MPTLRTLTRTTATSFAALAGSLILTVMPGSTLATQPEALTCADVLATPSDTMAGMDHGGMNSSTPMADMDHGTPLAEMEQVEFDLMYIDMMIPHHESVIALAHVAVPELTHPDLIRIAEAIVDTQDAEIEALEELRDAWYPDAPTVAMDQIMGMPGMDTDMEMMDQVMRADWQVQSFCAAENKDLAFIEQVIPHHQMAVDTSESALEMAVHPELVAIAELVIAAQEQEIEELEAIRAELIGKATPAS